MNERNDDWSPAERQAFDELPREQAPPPGVDDRIVEALRGRGLIRAARPRPRRLVPIGALAAGLLLLAAGFALGRISAARPGGLPPGPRFAFFLLRGDERMPGRPEEEAARVEEYRAWARGLVGAGRFVTGEKLEDRGERLGAPPSPPAAPDSAAAAAENEIQGFFVVSASDLEEALAVARGCPHLRYGGRILVRPIAPV